MSTHYISYKKLWPKRNLCLDFLRNFETSNKYHCVKSVQLRSFSRSVFPRILTEYGKIRSISPYSVQMRENTDQTKIRIWIHFTQCMFLIIIITTILLQSIPRFLGLGMKLIINLATCSEILLWFQWIITA